MAKENSQPPKPVSRPTGRPHEKTEQIPTTNPERPAKPRESR